MLVDGPVSTKEFSYFIVESCYKNENYKSNNTIVFQDNATYHVDTMLKEKGIQGIIFEFNAVRAPRVNFVERVFWPIKNYFQAKKFNGEDFGLNILESIYQLSNNTIKN